MPKSVIDYGFYLVQRGEVGHISSKTHPNGFYTGKYNDSKGFSTIGIGTVRSSSLNSIGGYSGGTITRDLSVDYAQVEMLVKIDEKCRKICPNFDQLLPCYQAVLIDAAYQGKQSKLKPLASGNAPKAYSSLMSGEGNRERRAVRGRALEMGMMIEKYHKENPNADPKEVAKSVSNALIAKYGRLKGDVELTKDELAMVYHSCNAAYGVPTNDVEASNFALSHLNVASGLMGIGSSWMPQSFEDRKISDALMRHMKGHTLPSSNSLNGASESALARSEKTSSHPNWWQRRMPVFLGGWSAERLATANVGSSSQKMLATPEKTPMENVESADKSTLSFRFPGLTEEQQKSIVSSEDMKRLEAIRMKKSSLTARLGEAEQASQQDIPLTMKELTSVLGKKRAQMLYNASIAGQDPSVMFNTSMNQRGNA